MDEDSNLVGDHLDEVKRNIYGYWKIASHYQKLVNKQKVQLKLDRYNYEEDFKASVIELYDACAPKFGYHEKTDCVKAIRKIGFIQIGARFTLSTAEALFKLLTFFVEIDGISKFEEEKYISKPS